MNAMHSSWMLQYVGFLWRGPAITPSAEAGVLRGVPSAWLGSGPAVGAVYVHWPAECD